MRSLEDLLNDVRDEDSKVHVSEAISAYNAGAFRAAIITTWIAVAFDLTAKIRELAEQSDKAAIEWIDKLTKAISDSSRQPLQKLESELLHDAKNKFSFINEREFIELQRLHDDRHVCAHPAFVDSETIFTASPELVRSHFRAAISAVLSQPPTPGRQLLGRYFEAAASQSWPTESAKLGQYLNTVYFSRGKDSLQSSITQCTIKGILAPPQGNETTAARLAAAAHEIEKINPKLFCDALKQILSKRIAGDSIQGDGFLRLIAGLGDMEVLWNCVDKSTKYRMTCTIEKASLSDLTARGVFSIKLAFADAEQAKTKRHEELSEEGNYEELKNAVTATPLQLFWPQILKQLKSASNYRTAKERVRDLVVPLAPGLDDGGLTYLSDAIKDNNQIRLASAMPSYVDLIFDESPKTKINLDIWKSLSKWLIDQEKDGDYYQYPGLANRLRAQDSDAPQSGPT